MKLNGYEIKEFGLPRSSSAVGIAINIGSIELKMHDVVNYLGNLLFCLASSPANP
jgi:hypothetical protein